MKIELIGGPLDGHSMDIPADFELTLIAFPVPERVPAAEFRTLEDRLPVFKIYRKAIYRKSQTPTRWNFVE